MFCEKCRVVLFWFEFCRMLMNNFIVYIYCFGSLNAICFQVFKFPHLFSNNIIYSNMSMVCVNVLWYCLWPQQTTEKLTTTTKKKTKIKPNKKKSDTNIQIRSRLHFNVISHVTRLALIRLLKTIRDTNKINTLCYSNICGCWHRMSCKTFCQT